MTNKLGDKEFPLGENWFRTECGFKEGDLIYFGTKGRIKTTSEFLIISQISGKENNSRMFCEFVRGPDLVLLSDGSNAYKFQTKSIKWFRWNSSQNELGYYKANG